MAWLYLSVEAAVFVQHFPVPLFKQNMMWYEMADNDPNNTNKYAMENLIFVETRSKGLIGYNIGSYYLPFPSHN